MKNIYQLALDVQNASNPSGVLLSLTNEVLPAIRTEPGYVEQGTVYLKHHPVLLLFLDKLVSLTEAGWIHTEGDLMGQAYTRVHELAEGLAAVEAKREADEDLLAADERRLEGGATR